MERNEILFDDLEAADLWSVPDNVCEIPATVDEATTVLEHKADALIEACRCEIGRGQFACAPQAGDEYPGVWLRDYAYMLEGRLEAFTEDELCRNALMFFDAQREDGVIPESILSDGSVCYKPGKDTMGVNPVTDSAQFAVDMLWHTCQVVDDPEFRQATLPKAIAALQSVPRSARTELVHIDPGTEWERCPYGFTDTVRKTGDVLFSSLLYVQACNQLADLLQTDGQDGQADMWRATSQSVSKKIRMHFWDKNTGLFRASSRGCNQHDVWGSAFAVYLNVATSGQLMAISRYLQVHYNELVYRGQLRHLPAEVCWDDTSTPPGIYQNGGYWAAPVGWLVYALDILDPALADQAAADLVADFEMHGIFEWISEDDNGVANYVASAALPIAGFKRTVERREKRAGMGIISE